jgi:membrane associated rhomboid family serine protease
VFVVPIERDNPTRHRHFVLWALIAANTLVFFPSWFLTDHVTFFRAYGFVPVEAAWTSVYTSMFVHGGWMHLVGNMVFLWMFGDNVEDVIGPFAFLAAYLLGGAAAVLAYFPFHASSTTPLVGASGAVSAVVGMYLVFFPHVKADLVIYFWRWEINTVPTTILGAVVAWFVEQLALMLIAEFTSLGQFVRVAFSAHVGGFLAGALLGSIFIALGYMHRYAASNARHWLFGYVTQPAVPAVAPRIRPARR